MDGVRRYEDLVAWQLCLAMSRVIFEMTQTGPSSKDLEFRNQIRKAADATAPLIAEGFVRYTTPEMVRYLRMARAELAEVQTHLQAGEDKRYFTPDQLERARPAVNRAMGTTTNLLKAKLRQLEEERRRRTEKKARHR